MPKNSIVDYKNTMILTGGTLQPAGFLFSGFADCFVNLPQ